MKSIGITLLGALLSLPAQAPPPALPVGADCAKYASTHTLVRNDVLAKLDAADQNLPKAEAALKQAETDLKTLKSAVDQLQNQKQILEGHITLLENALKMQREAYIACASGKGIAEEVTSSIEKLAGDAWETMDAPLGFAAGAGVCMGIAWGLNQVQK